MGFCRHDNETSDFIKGRKCFDQLSHWNCFLLKKDCDPGILEWVLKYSNFAYYTVLFECINYLTHSNNSYL